VKIASRYIPWGFSFYNNKICTLTFQKLYGYFLSRKWLFCYCFIQKEGVNVYDNEDILLITMDDDLFPIEKEDTEND